MTSTSLSWNLLDVQQLHAVKSFRSRFSRIKRVLPLSDFCVCTISSCTLWSLSVFSDISRCHSLEPHLWTSNITIAEKYFQSHRGTLLHLQVQIRFWRSWVVLLRRTCKTLQDSQHPAGAYSAYRDNSRNPIARRGENIFAALLSQLTLAAIKNQLHRVTRFKQRKCLSIETWRRKQPRVGGVFFSQGVAGSSESTSTSLLRLYGTCDGWI